VNSSTRRKWLEQPSNHPKRSEVRSTDGLRCGHRRQGDSRGLQGNRGLSIGRQRQVEVRDVLMTDAAEGLKGLESDSARAALALKIFGRSGTEMLPMIMEGLREAREQAREFGVVMSGESSKAAETFGDSLDRLKLVLGMAFVNLGIAAMPVLQKLVDWLTRLGPNHQEPRHCEV